MMSQHVNQYGQPVGQSMFDWQPRPLPQREVLRGQFCHLEPFSVADHAGALWQAWSLAEDGRDWTYLSEGPFNDETAWLAHAATMEASQDPLHFSVIDVETGNAVGTLSLMRVDAQNGAMEVGYVTFSRLLKQTRMATEAHFLLMRYAFEQLGYRRYEWKCDSCNLPSRRAALRLGFCFEGEFRQARVYKGRTRDTSWFSIIDSEWPTVKNGLERWLAEANFTADGRQREKLENLRG